MFSKTSDILKLTGLPDRNALWDAGFNLDDWEKTREIDIKIKFSATDTAHTFEYTAMAGWRQRTCLTVSRAS